MPGYLLQVGATVTCSHGGTAMATSPNPSVLVSGQPTATISGPWVVAGCPLVPPAPGPCITATWITGTVRILSNGMPLVFQGGVAVCAPSGTPLVPVASQTRVNAT